MRFSLLRPAGAFLFGPGVGANLNTAPYSVTSAAADGSTGTLRWAINQANSDAGSTIALNDNLGTIRLTSALQIITTGMTINGGSGNTINGNGLHRVFFVNTANATDVVTINNVTNADDGDDGGGGGDGGDGVALNSSVSAGGGINGGYSIESFGSVPGLGGGGCGGAIFVHSDNGASLTFTNGSEVGSTVTAGTGGTSLAGNPYAILRDAQNGWAVSGAIFLPTGNSIFQSGTFSGEVSGVTGTVLQKTTPGTVTLNGGGTGDLGLALEVGTPTKLGFGMLILLGSNSLRKPEAAPSRSQARRPTPSASP